MVLKLSEMGFQIYRLTEATENNEMLLYDTNKDKYYQYSWRRGKDFLEMMLEKLLDKDLGTILFDFDHLEDYKETFNVSKINRIFDNIVVSETTIIENIEYYPIEKKILEFGKEKYFNIYKKPSLLKEELESGDFPFIEKLIKNLVGYDEKGYEYFNNWLAWIVQNPHQRLATSIVLQGQQGSGKTLFCNYVLQKIFGINYCEISQEDINNSFNDYIMGKQLIVANEVIYNEKYTNSSEKLKNFISDDYVSVRRKYRDPVFLRNFSHFIFTSNQQVPVKIEHNDRRFSVFKSEKLENGVEFFEKFTENYEKEIRHYLNYLINKEVKLREVNYPYWNEVKRNLVNASLNSIESFISDAKEVGGFSELNDWLSKYYGDKENHTLLNPDFDKTNKYRIDRLYHLYKRWCSYNDIKKSFGRNNFTNMLKFYGYDVQITKDNEGKSVRCIEEVI